MSKATMSKVTIIGAGFGGLTAIRQLRKANKKVEITLISPEPTLVYLPSLIWIPSGLRQPNDLRVDLGNFIQGQDIIYHQGRVTGLKNGGRTVVTDHGEVENDALIIASGGRFLKKLPGIEHALTICEGIDAAVAIRDRLAAMKGGRLAFGFATNPKAPGAMRGGPMFELLFGTHTQLRRERRRKDFDITFFCPSPRPGQRLGEAAVDGLLARMDRCGIDTHLGHKLVRFEEGRVVTEGGAFDADMILFMPGMTGPDWTNESGLALTEGGHFAADEFAQVNGAERVYVVGDAGDFPGPDWQAKQAHAADLQAEAAAANLLLALKGRPAKHRIRHEIVCIIDTLDKGILVYRSEKRSAVLPPTVLSHWAKRAFEKQYLKPYR